MYVTTFYSYKGGVGRTLALLNVAYELAASGQKVLVVDFDLEAPAIHSGTWKSQDERAHEEGETRSTDPGIVDYVGHFIQTLHAPRAEDHIVDATPPDCAGKIALMPSGAMNDDYGRRLSAIDWNELYRKRHGYAMFEDLRKQWEILAYDYVLLDSRTGVTDVGGICTRHLPDAVVMMFRPDDQSLDGTVRVANAIRNERPAPGRDRVRLHFVMAGIPDVDDEHGILDELREKFRIRLNIPAPPGPAFTSRLLLDTPPLLEIRNYQSMDLLQQPIYTRLRDRTKLARSFQELTKRIRRANLDDRGGVLEYLTRSRDWLRAPQDGILDEIHRRYGDDTDVLGGLADVLYSMGDPKAIDLLEQIAVMGTLSPSQLVTLAEMRHATGDREGSLRAITAFFRNDHTTSFQSHNKPDRRHVLRAVRLLEILEEDRAQHIKGSLIVEHLPADQRAGLAMRLDRSRRERRAGIKILEGVLSSGQGSPAERNAWASLLAFARVATGDFKRASEYYRGALSEKRTIQDAFNFAMANWGDSKLADIYAFRRVLDLRDEENTRERRRHDPDDPNYLQAIAVAEWFAGRGEEARQYLRDVRQHFSEATGPRRRPRYAISCWSYTRVPVETFLEHCDEIGRLFDGDNVKPVFMRDAE